MGKRISPSKKDKQSAAATAAATAAAAAAAAAAATEGAPSVPAVSTASAVCDDELNISQVRDLATMIGEIKKERVVQLAAELRGMQ